MEMRNARSRPPAHRQTSRTARKRGMRAVTAGKVKKSTSSASGIANGKKTVWSALCHSASDPKRAHLADGSHLEIHGERKAKERSNAMITIGASISIQSEKRGTEPVARGVDAPRLNLDGNTSTRACRQPALAG